MDAENIAAPDAPEPFYREEHHPADAAFVRGLDVPELRTLFKALNAMDDAVTAICNRPVAAGQDPVTDWLGDLSERFSDIRSYAIDELQRRPMTGSRMEDEWTIAAVVDWIFGQCGEDALAVAEIMLRMKRDSMAAEHKRRMAP